MPKYIIYTVFLPKEQFLWRKAHSFGTDSVLKRFFRTCIALYLLLVIVYLTFMAI